MSVIGARFLLALTVLLLALQPAAAQGPTEYDVKAAFIHNIAKFVEWPATVGAKRSLRLCILGQGPAGEAVGALRGKPVGSEVWEVVQVGARAHLSECQVLFIEASEAGNLPRLLSGIANSPVLTVGDTDGYGVQGVMVNFYLEQNKVRFEINLPVARRAGLTISSQVLKLARIVQPRGAGQ